MVKISGNGVYGENAQTFEQSFLRLQEVVRKLSEGNLTLQQALAAFEEGMALADSCGRMLEEAELRVRQVSDRATQAGAASLPDMHEAMRLVSSRDEEIAEEDDEPELLSFEIETYETVIQTSRSKAPAPRSKIEPITPGPQRPTAAAEPTGKSPSPKARDSANLDPLFDEDD